MTPSAALAAYNRLPVTATPYEFLNGLGNWGLTEEEAAEAHRLALIISPPVALTNNGHRTAIARKVLSLPAEFLRGAGLLRGDVLDYGCGRGDDVRSLRKRGYIIQGFDPFYAPVMPSGQFTTIMSNYVLNVIPDQHERNMVVRDIYHLLNRGGTAYISVRNDKRALKGWTSKGTWQGYVELPYEVLFETAGYVMYLLRKRF